MNNQMNGLPNFSRSIFGGKKSSKLEARVSDELKEVVRRKWNDAGFDSESEWLELLVAVACFGTDHVRMLQEQRIRQVSSLSDRFPTLAEQTSSGSGA